MIATQTSSWWPFVIVAGGGGAWTVLCIAVANRFERHDGPLSFALIPVLFGMIAIVIGVESVW